MQCSSYLRVQSSGFLLLLSPLLSPYFQEKKTKPICVAGLGLFCRPSVPPFIVCLWINVPFHPRFNSPHPLLSPESTLWRMNVQVKKTTVRQRKRRPFIHWKDSKSFIPTILVFQQLKLGFCRLDVAINLLSPLLPHATVNYSSMVIWTTKGAMASFPQHPKE